MCGCMYRGFSIWVKAFLRGLLAVNSKEKIRLGLQREQIFSRFINSLSFMYTLPVIQLTRKKNDRHIQFIQIKRQGRYAANSFSL